MRYEQLKFLLVDDNAHMRALLCELLKALGCREIYEATDGADGLQALRAHAVDIVLADLAMEPLDGIEFVRLLRNSPDSPNPLVPVIMITGHATERRVAEARDVGVNEFLAKPITATGVMSRISRVIEHSRDFIRTDGYFGPDRRRRDDPNYRGAMRRSTDVLKG